MSVNSQYIVCNNMDGRAEYTLCQHLFTMCRILIFKPESKLQSPGISKVQPARDILYAMDQPNSDEQNRKLSLTTRLR